MIFLLQSMFLHQRSFPVCSKFCLFPTVLHLAYICIQSPVLQILQVLKMGTFLLHLLKRLSCPFRHQIFFIEQLHIHKELVIPVATRIRYVIL